MVTIEQMRQALIKRYPGAGWADKVKLMPDSQVVAIHSKFISKKKEN